MMRFILLSVIVIFPACSRSQQGGAGGEEFRASDEVAIPTCRADEFASTVVSAHLDYPLAAGTNVLWCATAQIAWNELGALVGEDIHMKQEDPSVAILNRRDVTRGDLDEQTYMVSAGVIGEGVLEDIRTKLNERFAGKAAPELALPGANVPDNFIVVYSYLLADLPFEFAFERLKDPLVFDATEVESFGIRQFLESQENEKRSASQLRVYDYRNENDFIVELKTRLDMHRVFLAKIPPESTLMATIAAAQKRVSSAQPTTIEECSDLRIPVVSFDTIREYSELQSRPLILSNPRFHDYEIIRALQQIRFRLDERGAHLKSEATIVAALAQNLVFDRPFLIMIQYDKAKMPYFALWVENAELLVRRGD